MRRSHHKLTKPSVFASAAWRQAKHILHHKIMRIKNANSSPITEVKFWPSQPHPYSVAYRLFHMLGVKIKHGLADPEKGELGFLWKDDTFTPAPPVNGLLNGKCLDISKELVEIVHRKVFNYSLAVDPLTYSGLIVIKSNLNGEHDGIESFAPLKEQSTECVYQLVVDNHPIDGRDDQVCDFRVPVFLGLPAFTYMKIRSKSTRFSNTNLSVSIIEDISKVFTPEEIELIQLFCRESNLDYGEIDIVRDWKSKRIYILNINKTPLGPPNGLSEPDYKLALELYSKYFSYLITNYKNANEEIESSSIRHD